MFTKYVRTGSATATVNRYRNVTDWDAVMGAVVIGGLILIALAAG